MRLLRVDTNKIQHLPYFLQQSVKIEFHVAADHNTVLPPSQFINLFHGDGVNFIVTIKATHVFTIPLNDIDEIVNATIVVNQNVSIVDFIFTQHILNCLFIESRQGFSAVKLDTTKFSLSYVDIWWISIQSDAYLI